MPAENNGQAARRCYEEVINGRNLDTLDELLTPEQAKQFFGMIHQAFPDLHAEVHDVIAEGDLVAARVTYTGSHQGEFVFLVQLGVMPGPGAPGSGTPA